MDHVTNYHSGRGVHCSSRRKQYGVVVELLEAAKQSCTTPMVSTGHFSLGAGWFRYSQ